jgi:hypothetical protein
MTDNATPKKLQVVLPPEGAAPVAKPKSGHLMNRFRSSVGTADAVAPLPRQLPHFKIAEAKDFVRLHPDEAEYWSFQLAFVNVPIIGQKRDTLHLIDETVAAEARLPRGKLQHFRLALASKPHDVHFLCHVPSLNLDNQYNKTSRDACYRAQGEWVEVVSLRLENKEDYDVVPARNQEAFPEPKWPDQSLLDIIENAFEGRLITDMGSPALARLIGDRQNLK